MYPPTALSQEVDPHSRLHCHGAVNEMILFLPYLQFTGRRILSLCNSLTYMCFFGALEITRRAVKCPLTTP